MKAKTTHQKLAAYSALSSAFLFAGAETQAQVVFTDIDPDFIYTEETATPPEFAYVNLDFDGDGMNEALIGFGNLQFAGSCYTSGYMSFYAVNYSTQGSLAITSTTGGNVHPKIFNEGELIDADANWNNYILRSFIRTDFYNDKCDADIEYATFNGNWNNTTAKYAGFRFLTGGNYNYCWVRMSVKVLADSGDAVLDTIRVFGFACEQTANTGIIAGNGFININDAVTEQNISVQLYPNPVYENLFLQFENAVADKLYYVITDLEGRSVLNGKLEGTNTAIPVKEIPQGLYIIHLLNEENENVAAQKFIKQ
jgi:hypothetical protein